MTCGKFYLNCEQMIHFALKQDAAAVSYTHLDVYKRQGQGADIQARQRHVAFPCRLQRPAQQVGPGFGIALRQRIALEQC